MRPQPRSGWKSGHRARLIGLAHLKLVLVMVLCAASGPALAEPREYVLRFLQPEGAPVDGYRLHLAPEGGPLAAPHDLGFVAPDADGINRTILLLDSTIRYEIGMTAYNAAGESDLSNLIVADAMAMACDAALCSDGNACTVDACAPTGCSHASQPDGTACNDGFVDTLDDQCLAGECVGSAPECTDRLACDDGNVCNGLESCGNDGTCLAGAPLRCGAATACEDSLCDPELGCLRRPRPDGTPCDDGLTSTRNDRCQGGACVGKRRGKSRRS